MTVIHRAALVEYSTFQMYNLVNDIHLYPEFVPMCKAVEVHKHTETEAEATLKISKGGVKLDLGTKNVMYPHKEIKIQLTKGPFKYLSGLWRFKFLYDKACKISLDLDFEFSNHILAMTLGMVFNTLANTMLEAFCKRATVVYGEC